MGVNFGIHIGPQNISIEDLRRLWTIADTRGFKWISVWDHFYEAPPVDGNATHFEAVALMSAIACETKNVEIGNYVFCMNYRNPAVLLKSLITVDHLSGGRCAIGLGAGWHTMEHQAYGFEFRPPKERLDMLEEGTKIIKSLMENERTTFPGTYFQMDNAAMYPKPVRNPMPIWIGGRGEKRTLRIAARHADGWNVPYIGADEFAHKNDVLDMWCEREGRAPNTIKRSINLHFFGVDSDAKMTAAQTKLQETLGRTWELQAPGALVGGPQAMVDQIGKFVDIGTTAINIAFRPPVDWEGLEAFVTEVMPKFA